MNFLRGMPRRWIPRPCCARAEPHASMARKDDIVGSGNVFEDPGHPRPAEALAKAEFAHKICGTCREALIDPGGRP